MEQSHRDEVSEMAGNLERLQQIVKSAENAPKVLQAWMADFGNFHGEYADPRRKLPLDGKDYLKERLISTIPRRDKDWIGWYSKYMDWVFRWDYTARSVMDEREPLDGGRYYSVREWNDPEEATESFATRALNGVYIDYVLKDVLTNAFRTTIIRGLHLEGLIVSVAWDKPGYYGWRMYRCEIYHGKSDHIKKAKMLLGYVKNVADFDPNGLGYDKVLRKGLGVSGRRPKDAMGKASDYTASMIAWPCIEYKEGHQS